MCADFAAHGASPGCPTESATGSRQLLAAVQLGSGRLFPTPLTELDQRDKARTAKAKKRTNEFKEKPTSKRGREEVTVAGVC